MTGDDARGFARTYEGLKLPVPRGFSLTLRTRFARTYEGLKLVQRFLSGAANGSFARTYEGLKRHSEGGG